MIRSARGGEIRCASLRSRDVSTVPTGLNALAFSRDVVDAPFEELHISSEMILISFVARDTLGG